MSNSMAGTKAGRVMPTCSIMSKAMSAFHVPTMCTVAPLGKLVVTAVQSTIAPNSCQIPVIPALSNCPRAPYPSASPKPGETR